MMQATIGSIQQIDQHGGVGFGAGAGPNGAS